MGRVLSAGGIRTPQSGRASRCIDLTDEESLARTISQDVACLTGKSKHMARAALNVVGEDRQEAYALLMSDMSLTVVEGGPCEVDALEVGTFAWLGCEGVISSIGGLENCSLLRLPRYHRGELRLFALEPMEIFLLTRNEEPVAPDWAEAHGIVCPELSAVYSGNCRRRASLQTRFFHPGPAAIPLDDVEFAAVRFVKKPSGARPPVNSRRARVQSPPSVGSVDPIVKEQQDRSRSTPSASARDLSAASRYRRISHLGSGAFGSVHLAERSDGKQVAVKCIPTQDAQEMREVHLMQRASHACVVPFLECFMGPGQDGKDAVYIVMEYLPQNLHARIGGKPLEAEPLRNYSRQLLRALAHLDSLSICHRDVKPENILLASETLKLGDFGSAKVLNDEEASTSYICSRWWRAPELILGATKYSTSIDWWSCGCVIAEMMCGEPIFTGTSSWGQMYAIIRALGTPAAGEMEALTPHHGGGRLAKHLESLVKLRRPARPWAEMLPAYAELPKALELPGRLLVFSPMKRWHPIEALTSAFLVPALETSTLPDEAKQRPLAAKWKRVSRRSKPLWKHDREIETYLGKRSADAVGGPARQLKHQRIDEVKRLCSCPASPASSSLLSLLTP